MAGVGPCWRAAHTAPRPLARVALLPAVHTRLGIAKHRPYSRPYAAPCAADAGKKRPREEGEGAANGNGSGSPAPSAPRPFKPVESASPVTAAKVGADESVRYMNADAVSYVDTKWRVLLGSCLRRAMGRCGSGNGVVQLDCRAVPASVDMYCVSLRVRRMPRQLSCCGVPARNCTIPAVFPPWPLTRRPSRTAPSWRACGRRTCGTQWRCAPSYSGSRTRWEGCVRAEGGKRRERSVVGVGQHGAGVG